MLIAIGLYGISTVTVVLCATTGGCFLTAVKKITMCCDQWVFYDRS